MSQGVVRRSIAEGADLETKNENHQFRSMIELILLESQFNEDLRNLSFNEDFVWRIKKYTIARTLNLLTVVPYIVSL